MIASIIAYCVSVFFALLFIVAISMIFTDTKFLSVEKRAVYHVFLIFMFGTLSWLFAYIGGMS